MRTIELLVRTFLTMNISDPNPPFSITGGTRNLPQGDNNYPWFASVQLTNHHSGFHHCSGILIDPNWILTVAHCLESEKPNDLWATIGESNLYKNKTKEDYHAVHFFVKHPKYLYYVKPYIYDIALMRLKNPVIIDEFVKPANLTSFERVKGDCEEIEWMENRKENEFYLRKTPVDFRELDVCHENYVNILNDGQNICVEKKEYDKICESSAGTILECVVASGQKSIIGLSSWVGSCDKPQKPIVFVNISYHLTWITNTMEKYKSGIPPSSSPSPTPPQTSTTTSTTSTPSNSSTKCKDKKEVTEQTTKEEEDEDDNNDEYSYDDFWGK